MTDVRTGRLQLHPVDVAEAQRVMARRPGPTDSWAPDFPFEGDDEPHYDEVNLRGGS